VLESQAPSVSLKAYAYNEIRYRMLSYTDPPQAQRLLELGQQDVVQRWNVYRALAERYPPAAVRGQGSAGSQVAARVEDRAPAEDVWIS
jgi:hypothetical protein